MAVRYRSEQILNLMSYEVIMVEKEVGDDSGESEDEEVFINRRSSDDYDLAWEGCEGDDQPSYFGIRVHYCYCCTNPVDKDEILKERRLGNWDVPICVKCVTHPEQRSYQGCHANPDDCICDELESGRNY